MDFDGDSQPLFDEGLAPLKAHSDIDGSDSEDEYNLSSLADNDAYSNMNIPESLKSILRMDTRTDDIATGDTQDDSESDDDSLFKGHSNKVDIAKLNEEIAKNKNQFANFPLFPPGTETQEERQRKVSNPIGSRKQPKEKQKKKRRDNGKQEQQRRDILEEADKIKRANNKKLTQLFVNFANEESEESDNQQEEEETASKIKENKKKQKGRRSRKQISNAHKVDENGERLVRTTEFLDTDTDDSSEEDDNQERALSRKQELEMLKESERLRRSANAVKLKPVYNVKSFDEFVKRRDEREVHLLNELEIAQQKEIEAKLQQKQAREKQQRLDEILKKQKQPVIVDESDEDLIIVGDPKKLAKNLLSPERARNPMAAWSPVKQASSTLKTHNLSMLNRITNEGYHYRIKMEQEAKARGQYATPTERAKKLLEKEQNALLIDAQVKSHFEKNKNNNLNNYLDDDEEEEEDEDYNEEEGAMSGQESEEEEFSVEDFDTRMANNNKRKIDMDNDDSEKDEEEEDMGVQAMKRWKGKKIRKSIFDDSDEEEENKKKKVAQKPVPAHSISNFFKAKATVVEEEVPIEDKPLTRLKRVIQRDEEEQEQEESDDADVMDIDEQEEVLITTPKKTKSPKLPNPFTSEQNNYLEQEAEESEDEFYGAGGEEIDDGENLDEFEEDEMLVHENNEHVDEAALREAFNRQDAESDSNLIQRLLKDVTGGGLRKQKAAAEAGLMLDDIDLYDEEDNDLIAIRRAAAARRRKLLKKKGDDPLDNLMNDPKTAAFAKAAQAIPEEQITGLLSDDDQAEEVEESVTMQSESLKAKLIIKEEDEEEEDEDDLMDINSDDEEESPVVREFNYLESPIRGTGVVSITSADDDLLQQDEEEDEFHVQTIQSAQSPLNNRKAKLSMFGSPSSMERFKRLMSETNGLSDAPRVGFGSTLSRTKSKNDLDGDGEEEEEENNKKKKNMSSIGGFLASQQTNGATPKKSKLSGLSKKRDAFQYVE